MRTIDRRCIALGTVATAVALAILIGGPPSTSEPSRAPRSPAEAPTTAKCDTTEPSPASVETIAFRDAGNDAIPEWARDWPEGVVTRSLDDTAPSFASHVRGIVVDEQGRPVEGALVKWQRILNNGLLTMGFCSYTDASGAYQLHLPDACSTLELTAYAPVVGVGSCNAARIAGLSADEAPTIVLREGRVLEGVLVYPDGRPAPAVELLISCPGADTPFVMEVETPPTVHTGSDGRFRIAGLRDGLIELTELGTSSEWLAVARVPSGTRDLRLVTGVHRIHVSISAARAPKERVDLWVRCLNLERRVELRSDAKTGTVLLPRTPGVEMRVRIVGGEASIEQVVEPSDAWLQQVSITLPEVSTARALHIRAEDPGGRPWPRFEARLVWAITRCPLGDLKLDENGLTGIPLPEGEFVVEAEARGEGSLFEARYFLPAACSVTLPPSGTVDAALRFRRGGRFALLPSLPDSAAADGSVVRALFRRLGTMDDWQRVGDSSFLDGHRHDPQPIPLGGSLEHGAPLEPGRYEARLWLSSRYDADAPVAGHEPTLVVFDVLPGKTTEVFAELPPAR